MDEADGLARKRMTMKQRLDTKGALWMTRDRRCHLCGGEIYRYSEATLDHVITRSSGGSDDPDNLSLAHELCNGRRGNMTMDEWSEYRTRRWSKN